MRDLFTNGSQNEAAGAVGNLRRSLPVWGVARVRLEHDVAKAHRARFLNRETGRNPNFRLSGPGAPKRARVGVQKPLFNRDS